MTQPPSSHSSSEPLPKISRPLLFQIGGLALACVALFALSSQYPVIEWIGDSREHIQKLGVWSGVLFPVIYAACNLLLLPGGVLSIGGGFFFGLWWGFALVLCGNLLGATVAFTIARKIGRQRIERLLSRNRRLRLLDHVVARHGWKIVVLSQLNPLAPSSLLNYLYGLSRVKLSRCLLWIAIGQSPGLFLYSFVGTLGQFGLDMARGTRRPFFHDYLFWGGGFVLTTVTTLLLSQLARRIMVEADTGAG